MRWSTKSSAKIHNFLSSSQFIGFVGFEGTGQALSVETNKQTEEGKKKEENIFPTQKLRCKKSVL
jgi:hypothetical protein